MITGVGNSNREAIIRLVVAGPRGQQQEIEAIIDTGFTGFLTLPSDRVAALGLSWLSRQPGILKILAHPVGGFLNLQLRRPPLDLDGLVTL